nr:hypothetical protein [Actinomycetales bacterium]
MSRELVILAEGEPSPEDWTAAATPLIGGGDVVRFAGDLRHMVDLEGNTVVSWWPARTLDARREVVAELGEDARTVRVWVDVSLPHTENPIGLQVARAVTARVAGTLIERT